jgi:hypothetical protein
MDLNQLVYGFAKHIQKVAGFFTINAAGLSGALDF